MLLLFQWKVVVLQRTNQNDVVSGAAAGHPRGNRHSLDHDLGLGRVRDLCRGGLIFSSEDAVAVAPGHVGHVGHVRAFVLEMTSRVCDDAGGCCCSRDLVIEQLTSAMHNKKENKKDPISQLFPQ